MRITVITPYDSSNFGAFLQAYCLKIQLEKMGHEVFHMQTRSADYVLGLYYKEKPARKKEFIFRWKFEKEKKYGIRKHELFLADQKAFQITCNPQSSDVFVLGSDEIWNINQLVFQKDIFWGIGLIPAISYAASIGSAGESFFYSHPQYIDAIDKLKMVLVRDIRTKKLVDTKTTKNARIVCDPTMLVAVRDYGSEFWDEYISVNQCLLVYAYYIEKEARLAIKAYAKSHNMKIVSCCFWHEWCDYQCECSPLQFSSLIRQCKAVFTTTFHGSIFSILNHANFVSVPLSPKTSQLLEQFDLQRWLLPEEDISEKNLSTILDENKINYYAVEQKIAEVRKDSMEKLEEALNIAYGG